MLSVANIHLIYVHEFFILDVQKIIGALGAKNRIRRYFCTEFSNPEKKRYVRKHR